MSISISLLAKQMQDLFEKNNGEFSGGFLPIKNPDINPQYARAENDGNCGNLLCNRSHNGGNCSNELKCDGATNDGPACKNPLVKGNVFGNVNTKPSANESQRL